MRRNLSSSPTPRVLADLQEKRNLLYRRIDNWRNHQDRFLPSAMLHRANPTASTGVSDLEGPSSCNSLPTPNVEDLPLLLPSSLMRIFSGSIQPEVRALGAIEARLRVAHADDSLTDLRKHLRIRQALFHYKKIQVTGTGQRPNTRARAIIAQQTSKINRSAERYRASRRALISLDPGGDWEIRIQPLHDKDIRHPSEREDGESEGHRVTTWIWLAPRSPHTITCPQDTASNAEIDQSLRIEWAKSYART